MVAFSMHQYDSDAEEFAHGQRRPLGLALLSGVFFGGVGAAASNWLAQKTIPHVAEMSRSLSVRWITAIGGIFAGLVAFHGARHMPKDQIEQHKKESPRPIPVAKAESPKDEHIPVTVVAAKDAELDEMLARQSKNLGL